MIKILKKAFISISFSLAAILMIVTPVMALTSHDNPDTAKSEFNGVSLLKYFSSSLDLVILRDPAAVEKSLDKMPFVNIPAQLNQTSEDFAASSIILTYSLSEAFKLWDQENILVSQYRVDDIPPIKQRIAGAIPSLTTQFNRLKASIIATGSYLKVDTNGPNSQLRIAYDDVLSKIQRLSSMLDILVRSAIESENLIPTRITLEVVPASTFVGEIIKFQGSLSSLSGTLGNRTVDIFYNNSASLSVTCDVNGEFFGQLQVPYIYRPLITVQAVYSPTGDDIGRYFGTASLPVNLSVLFYSQDLVVTVDNPVYPGLTANIKGTFNYGQISPIERDGVEIFLDEVPIGRFKAQPDFSWGFPLDAGVSLGQHKLMISVPAFGRYAPVKASCIMTVAKAVSQLSLNIPLFGMIPSELEVNGNLQSVVGPVQDAVVNISIDNNRMQAKSSADGSFKARLGMPVDFSLLGSQDITFIVQPQDPWNTPLTVTRSIFLVNIISCVILLGVLIFLGFYLPRKVRIWIGAAELKPSEPEKTIVLSMPVYQQTPVMTFRKTADESEDPLALLFNWYRAVLNLVQANSRGVLKPQQTLREYAKENGSRLGPSGKYFLEFTLLIEKLLYSRRQPSADDIEKGRKLSGNFSQETKGENL
jgi:hypothetical protein